jgi:hypothetical protein
MAKETTYLNNRWESCEKTFFKFYFTLLPKLMNGKIKVNQKHCLDWELR